VTHHLTTATIHQPEFCVSEATRQWIQRERTRTVCAWISGIIDRGMTRGKDEGTRVSFDPYSCQYFVRCDTGEHVTRARRVYLTSTGAYALDPR